LPVPLEYKDNFGFFGHKSKIKPVKNLSLALNIVLLIAVAVLYFLFFKDRNLNAGNSDISQDTTKYISTPMLPKGTAKIVYINLDSLQEKYEYVKKLNNDLEYKTNADRSRMEAKAKQFQDEYIKFQQEVQGGGISEEQAYGKQQELQKKQQELEQMEQRLTKEYTEQAKKAQETYINTLNDFLKRKSKEHNYAFVLGYLRGGQVVFANDSLNITNVVAEGLNKEYKAKTSK
jgi:outer membrane protein